MNKQRSESMDNESGTSNVVYLPLSYYSTSRMGKETTQFYKRLADMIARKRQHYAAVIGWLRCRISFGSLRSAIMCIRGSRSSLHRPMYESNISLATSEGRIPRVEHFRFIFYPIQCRLNL